MSSIEAIINRQLLRWELERKKAEEQRQRREAPLPIVTISRQTGSRGSYFASRLAQRLGYQRLHREVIDAICESSGYRKRIIESLDDHVRSDLSLMVESLFTGQSVDLSDYARHLCRVILSMSHLGGVVVVGRGANFILGPRRGVHLRVICPKKRRIENLMAYKNISGEEARSRVEASDSERREFINKLFGKEVNDPQHYDVVFNSALIDVEEMVDMAVTVINAKLDKLMHLDNDQP